MEKLSDKIIAQLCADGHDEFAHSVTHYFEKLYDSLRTIQQQNKQMKEALDFYASIGVRFENGDWDVGEHAREVLLSIQGGSSNEDRS